MTLADTSAWVEFLRKTGSPTNIRLRDLLAEGELLTTEPVVMEVLAGAVDDHQHRVQLQRLMAGIPLLEAGGLATWQDAAGLYLTCRRGGETIRSLLDCLIAVVAIREEAPILHHNRDFEAIARHSELQVVST